MPQYAGKINDPQGRRHDGQSSVVRRIKLDLANVGADGVFSAVGICERETVKPEVRNNAMTSVLIKTHVFWRLSSQISFETLKGNSMMRSSKMRLKC